MKRIYIIAILLIGLVVVSCEKTGTTADSTAAGSVGVGGSLARFTIVGNYLYVADSYSLRVFKINSNGGTSFLRYVNVGLDIETIYPYENYLFLGSQTGMYIYSLADPENPSKLSQALHVRACDPVVAKDTFAYVTLRSGTRCGTATNALYTYNTKNVLSPFSVDTLGLPTPKGLGYKDTTMFVCCENSGLAVLSIKNPKKPILKNFITGNNFSDVIVINNLLVCMVVNGVALYDISNVNNIQLIKLIAN